MSSREAWELADWDAVETMQRIERRDVTAREVVDAAIARAEDTRALNAIVFLSWAQSAMHRVLTGGPMDATQLEPLTQGFAKQFRGRVWSSLGDMRRLRGWTAAYDRMITELDVDVLLLPTTAHLPPRHGHLGADVPFDEAVERLFAFCPFTGVFNSAGAPALSLPMARSASGLPIGVQLAARRGNDALLLELALALERARPWARAAPRDVS